MRSRYRSVIAIGVALVGVTGCSGTKTAEQLGDKAASAEIAYHVFGRETHAKTFMVSWYQACRMADKEGDLVFAKAIEDFDRGYVAGLKRDMGAAVRKPLQRMVRDRWWKTGTGCEGILRETPEWAREM